MHHTQTRSGLAAACLLAVLAAAHPGAAHADTRTVTNLADDGSAGTLRAQIAAAQPGDTVTFAVTGTITLNGTELLVNKNLTITGPGITLDANHQSRVFEVSQNAAVALNGLAVTNGKAADIVPNGGAPTDDFGGGIANFGALTLTNCTVSGNSARYENGGGIASFGTLTVAHCVVTGNAAPNGGGIYGSDIYGGISLTVTDSDVSHNTAGVGPDGAFIGGGYGGGIYSGHTVTITNSTINNNSAIITGGGLHLTNLPTEQSAITDSTISGNVAAQGYAGYGGGLNNAGRLTVTRCTVAGNTGAGGLSNGGALVVTDSAITGNATNNDGGGIYNNTFYSLTITNSTISGNTANNNGGGLCNYGPSTTVSNSTVFGNTAYVAGAIANEAAYRSVSLTLANSTVAGNTTTITGSNAAFYGGSIYNTGALAIGGSILADTAPLGNVKNNGAYATLTSNGYNLSSDGTGPNGPNDLLNTNPGLDPNGLQDNGGPTQTVALQAGSAARNAGDPNFDAVSTPYDQRGAGFPRIKGGRVDIGAFELNTPPTANAASVTTAEDTSAAITLTGSDPDNDPLTYRITVQPAHGALTGTVPNLTYTPSANYNGPDSFAFVVNDGTIDSVPATVRLTVTPVNDPPIAQDGSAVTPEDTTAHGQLKAADVDNDPLTFAKVADPDHGTVTVNPDGSYAYTPDANYNGPDSFTFIANDGTVNSNVAAISLTVTPVNDAPVAADAAVTTAQNTAVSGQLKAADVDNDPLTYKKVSGPAHGTVTVSASGAYTYTPSAGFSGTDSFTFAANDGTTDSNTAKITVTVTSAVVKNHAPVADAGPARLLFTLSRQISITLDGSGSRDADGDPLTYRWSDWGTQIATGVKPPVNLGLGLHLITLTVTDPSGASSTGATLIVLLPGRPR